MTFKSSNDVMMTSFIIKESLELSAILDPPFWKIIKCIPFYWKPA